MRTLEDLHAVWRALEREAPEPGSLLPVTRRPRRSATRGAWLLSAGAALAVVSAVVVAFVLVGHRSPNAPATPRNGRPPIALIDTDWGATSLDPAAGLTPPYQTGVVIRKDGTFEAGLDRCDGLLGRVSFTAHTATFVGQVWNHSCPSNPSSDSLRLADLVKRILTGTVQWSLRGNQLSLIKPDVGAILYTRGAHDTPSPT